MQFKKNFVSYIVMAVAMVNFFIIAIRYACNLLNDGTFTGIAIMSQLNSTESTAVITAIFFALCVAVFFALWGIGSLVKKNIYLSDKTIAVIEVIAVIILFCGAIAYRVYSIIDGGLSKVDINAPLYQSAFVNGPYLPGGFADSNYPAVYIFVITLNTVMRFVGNNPLALTILQCALQVISIFLVFGLGRRLYGYSVGFVAAAVLGFMPAYTDMMFMSVPGCLVGTVLLLMLYVFGCFAKREISGSKIVLGIFTGIILGIGIYLDSYTLIAAVLLLVGFIYELVYRIGNRGKVVLSYLILVIVMLGTIAGIIFIDALSVGRDFLQVAFHLINIFMNAPLPSLTLLDSSVLAGTEIGLVLLGLGVISLWSQFKRKECDTYALWIMLLIVAPAPLTRAGYLLDKTGSIIIYALIAGIAVRGMLYVPIRRKNAKAIDAAIEYIENIENIDNIDNTLEETSNLEEQTNLDDTKTAKEDKDIVILEEARNVEPIDRETTQVDDLPGMIPNPLPLPAKKKHINLDYGREIPEDQMFYDIDVPDDDDFDI